MVQRWNEDEDKPAKKAKQENKYDPANLTPLARTVGATLAMMKPGGSGLTFHMIETKPSPEMQAGLDELIAKGFVEKLDPPHEHSKAITYRPLVDMFGFFAFAGEVGHFMMNVPIEKKEKTNDKRKRK